MSSSEDWVWILVVAIVLVIIVSFIIVPFTMWMGWGGMMRMMSTWGAGWVIPLIYTFFIVVVVAVAAFGIYYLVKGLSEKTVTESRSLDKSLEILRERYARGEITREEYLRMRKDLETDPTKE